MGAKVDDPRVSNERSERLKVIRENWRRINLKVDDQKSENWTFKHKLNCPEDLHFE